MGAFTMNWKLNLSAALLAGLGFAAATGTAAAAPACDGPVKVGAISTVTGPADFSEVPEAARAVFDRFNAAGGLNGCTIDYTIADDRADPAVAAQAARDLIDNREVVALVGSASLLDCAVNAATYNRRGVLSVQGLGVDAACFNSPSVAPVNVGPYTLTSVMAYFASEHLGAEKFCAFFIILGGTQEAYAEGVADWEKITGKKAHLVDNTLPLQGDLTPYAIRARDAGCDAVLTNSVEPGVVQWINTVDAQQITGIDWLFLAPGYTDQVAETLKDTGQPIYVGTEWEPFTEAGSQANAEWIETMQGADRPLTAFSQGGYMAAQVFLDVLATIDGPVTRESVTAALHAMEPIDHPLGGNPYVFGAGERHTPMQSSKIMNLENGVWTVATQDWLLLPSAE